MAVTCRPFRGCSRVDEEVGGGQVECANGIVDIERLATCCSVFAARFSSALANGRNRVLPAHELNCRCSLDSFSAQGGRACTTLQPQLLNQINFVAPAPHVHPNACSS